MKTFYSLSWTAYCLAVCCYLLVASIIGQSSIVAQTSTSCMGDFMPYATVARSNGEMFRQFADINLDGLTDIITQESGAFARFYVNTGSSFQPAGTLQLPSFGNVVAAKDFDNDGWVDLLSNSITGQTCQSNQIRIFWNTGTDGSFFDATLSTNLPLPANPYCMQSQDIDFDGDGWMDVIATSMPFSPSTNSPGRTYKNNGSRNFSVAADFLWPRDLYGTHVRDFNGDGNADFMVTLKDGWADGLRGMYYFRGNGNGTFQTPIINFNSPPLAAGGFPIQSDPLVNATEDVMMGINGLSPSTLKLGRWNGLDNFTFSDISIPSGFSVGQSFDFDADGNQDLVLYSLPNQQVMTYLHGNGDATYASMSETLFQTQDFSLNSLFTDPASNLQYLTGYNNETLYVYRRSATEVIVNSISATICENTFFQFGEDSLSQSGVYSRPLAYNSLGCDSVVEVLTLYVTPSEILTFDTLIIEGESIEFNGQVITAPGTYTALLESLSGCDSSVVLNLAVVPAEDPCGNSLFLYNWMTLVNENSPSNDEVNGFLSGCSVYGNNSRNQNIPLSINNNGQLSLIGVSNCDALTATLDTDNGAIIHQDIYASPFGDLGCGILMNTEDIFSTALVANQSDSEIASVLFRRNSISGYEIFSTEINDDLRNASVILRRATPDRFYLYGNAYNNSRSATVHKLHCFDTLGNRLWTNVAPDYDYFYGYTGGITVDIEGNAYVTSKIEAGGGPFSYNVVIRKISLEGNELWRFEYNYGEDYAYDIELDAQGDVYFSVGVRPSQSRLVKLSGSTGQLVYDVNFHNQESYSSFCLQGEFCALVHQEYLKLFRASDGELLWSVQMGGHTADHLAFMGNSLVVTTIAGVEVYDLTGSLLQTIVLPNQEQYLYRSAIPSDDNLDLYVLGLRYEGNPNKIFAAKFSRSSTTGVVVLNESICEGSSYVFGNMQLTEAGNYTDTLVTALGCDSIVVLNLTVTQPLVQYVSATSCDTYTWDISGETFDSTGVYYYSDGCMDYVLDLLVSYSSVTQLSVEINNGQTYNFNGQQLSQAGSYEFVLSNASGCDSLVMVTLSVQPGNLCELIASQTTICSGESAMLGVISMEVSDSTVIPQYAVGDVTPSGGIVFYDKGFESEGWRYLEVMPVDVSGPTYYSGCYCTSIIGTTNALGSGYENSQIWSTYSCSLVPFDYFYGGYSGWYLPSVAELNEIYQSLALNDMGSFSQGGYWSSNPAPYGSCGIDGGNAVVSFVNGQSYGEYRPGFAGSGYARLARRFVAEPISSYLWSTAETTPTITVAPMETTTYSVMVTQGSQTCSGAITIDVILLDACGECGGSGIAGCDDPYACNYFTEVTCNDGSCVYPGCTDIYADNYDYVAGCDDGSCFYYYGCSDPSACNWTPEAVYDYYCYYPGCTDYYASNYDYYAGCDDGSCIYSEFGCSDPYACNWNPAAIYDDGSCNYGGCTNPYALNYDPYASCDDGSCFYYENGCSDYYACNWNPYAYIDDGSCVYPGCTDPLACNFNVASGCDDGSCFYIEDCQFEPFEDVTGLFPFSTDNAMLDLIDFNNDGLDDVISHQLHILESTKLYRNDGNSLFTDASLETNFPTSNYRKIADLNKDGFSDIVAYLYEGDNFTGICQLHLNSGALFSSPESCNSVNLFEGFGVSAAGLKMGKWSDFNNDGVYDLVQFVTSGGSTKLYGVPGSLACNECGYRLNFEQKQELWSVNAVDDFNFQFIDLDQDFDLDIITAYGYSQYSNYTYNVHLNNGSGQFTTTSDNLGILGGRVNAMTGAGELNNDGKVDMVSGAADCCTGAGDPLTVYLSTDNSYSTSITAMTKASYAYYNGTSITDFDLDGNLDVFWTSIAAIGSSALKLYKNDGQGGFFEVSNPMGLGLGLTYGCCPIPGYTHALVLDINDDKKPDADIHSIDWISPFNTWQDWTKLNTSTNNSLKLRLSACTGLSDGTAASVSYKTGGEWFYQQFYPKTQDNNQPFLYLGCGTNSIIDSLEIDWVGGAVSVYTGLSTGQYFVAVENANCVQGYMTAAPCDDNDPCTVNDIILADCSCAGTFADADNDGTCDANDNCAGPEAGAACDDNDPCTVNDSILADCYCVGTFADTDNDGTCDANDMCVGPEAGAACDDNDPCTVNDIIRDDCSCLGVYIDSDEDGVCDANDLCAGPEAGSICDDNDPCTVDDVILADCSCAGTIADSDNDGVCDAFDLCFGPEPGSNCDDGNPCTINDVVNEACTCMGEPVAVNTSITSATDCDSYMWNGQQYTASGTYTIQTFNAAGCDSLATLVLEIRQSSFAPQSASASLTTITAGQSVTLSVVGGSLGTNAQWMWYSGSCGGTLVGQGASISVSPSATATYFVRAVGECNTTACASVTVNVSALPCGPQTITASSISICAGNAVTLSVTGVLSTGAVWKWYKNGCGLGTSLGTGATIAVIPTTNTSYFVRAEGGLCGLTSCLSVAITVSSVPAKPTVIAGPNAALCSQQGVVYSTPQLSGVISYLWTVPSGATIVSGQGTSSITVNFSSSISPNSTCGYTGICVSALNGCGASLHHCMQVSLTPGAPAGIVASASVCSFQEATFSVLNPIAGMSYTWEVPNNWQILSGQGTSTITAMVGLNNGQVRVYATNTCGMSKKFSRFVGPINCNRSETSLQLDVWPNPASQNVKFAHGGIQPEILEIYDLLGREIYRGDWVGEWNVETLEAGIYFVRVTHQGESVVKRLEVAR